jgi:hypothetical protein
LRKDFLKHFTYSNKICKQRIFRAGFEKREDLALYFANIKPLLSGLLDGHTVEVNFEYCGRFTSVPLLVRPRKYSRMRSQNDPSEIARMLY